MRHPPQAVGECHSKADEDRLIKAERERLRAALVTGKAPPPRRAMKEALVRLVYVEMLGHDASFGYIHAVKLCCDSNPLLKRVGYLATSLFLSQGHELIMLIVNTLQRDLAAGEADPGVALAALAALCSLRVGADASGTLAPSVKKLLGHASSAVRKRSVMALHVMAKDDPSLADTLDAPLRAALCDRDPGVMMAAMAAIHEQALVEPGALKPLVPSFISILRQVAQRRLPRMYDYHRVPAPFLQIRMLKVLAALGASDRATSESMYGPLAEVLAIARAGGSESIAAGKHRGKRLDKAHVAAMDAIAYECVRTCASIYPNGALLKECAAVVGFFLRHSNKSVKYCGIEGLSCVVGVDATYAAEHQMAVIDCLQDSDETLVHKTLHLLHAMTNADNVETIVEHMALFVGNASGDSHARADIVGRVVELAERFAPSAQWYVQTLNTVFELGGELVPASSAHNLMRLLAEGSGETDEADAAMRATAVTAYVGVLRDAARPLSALPMQVACWTLGEYGALWSGGVGEVLDLLCVVPQRHEEDSEAARALALTAIAKLMAQGHALTPSAQAFARTALKSRSTDAQQRAYELLGMLQLDPAARAAAMPLDGAAEDIEVDASLSFLNGFVQQALSSGAQLYSPPDTPEVEAAPVAPAMSSGQDAPMYVPQGSQPQQQTGGLDDLATLGMGGQQASQVGSAATPPAPAPQVPAEPMLNMSGAKSKWGMPQPSLPRPATADLQTAPAPVAAAPPPAAYDGAGGSSFAPATAAAAPSTAPVDPNRARLAASLFGGGGGAAASTLPPAPAARPAPAPVAAPAPPPQDDLLGMLGGLSVHQQPVAAPAPAPPSDPLGDLLGMGGAPPAQTAAHPVDAVEALLMQPQQSAASEFRRQAGASPMSKQAPVKSDPFADLLG